MPFPLIAVDIGNSRLKFGLFERGPARNFPTPGRSLALGPDWQPAQLLEWLPRDFPLCWRIASVQRTSTARLLEWLANDPRFDASLLTLSDLPLAVDVEQPEQVGMDRLVNAV